MKTVAFIFARGGSEGLPGKNIMDFAGKPLIAWSIECAQKISRVERVIVSTDSYEIANISKSYGAEIPFIRPAYLATSESSEWDSWKHALNFLKDTDGSLPETMVSIPPVAPLRTHLDIEKCLDEYEKGTSDIVITVTDAHRSPFFNMVSTLPNGNFNLVCPPLTTVHRRQDVPIVYDMTTVCYVADTSFVLANNSIFDGRVAAVHIAPERSIDIDTKLDFQFAEFMMKLGREPT